MQDTGMQPHLVNLAIIVGLILTSVGFLVLIGLLGDHSQVAVSSARLIMCVGLGLVLGALGTRAEGKWRGVSMTGAGVVATALFAMQMYFTEPGFTKTGRIGVDFSKVAIQYY